MSLLSHRRHGDWVRYKILMHLEIATHLFSLSLLGKFPPVWIPALLPLALQRWGLHAGRIFSVFQQDAAYWKAAKCYCVTIRLTETAFSSLSHFASAPAKSHARRHVQMVVVKSSQTTRKASTISNLVTYYLWMELHQMDWLKMVNSIIDIILLVV